MDDLIGIMKTPVQRFCGCTGFKNWLMAKESSAATRHALGIYPPSPEDFITRPPYGAKNACGKIGNYKTFNMDVTQICGNKDSHKPADKKPKKVTG